MDNIGPEIELNNISATDADALERVLANEKHCVTSLK